MRLRADSVAVSNEESRLSCIEIHDDAKDYFFSISRFKDEEKIVIMVCDQLNYKVDNNLILILENNRLIAKLENGLAKNLDGHTIYNIDLEKIKPYRSFIADELKEIFGNKPNLIIRRAYTSKIKGK
ncbi:hypothetical protein FZC33_21955 [Labrys sp. KNU-23]|uniref:hypothetical protein n=1 Tax=Labrys sp. KNU-23 TaxID=2789216 RepID=UPI0011EEE6A3|nr:hypothetical protein [Labrys sp. KNU-23]QEN88800.1 hypothetical protein FZC33_21955 [Labrys sp. KNU-23]